MNLTNLAYTTLFAMQDMWDLGGDMRQEHGITVDYQGDLFTVKLELWNDDCLADGCATPAEARRRGKALAAQWERQGWPATGYFQVDDDIYGATWAADEGAPEDFDEDEVLVLRTLRRAPRKKS